MTSIIHILNGDCLAESFPKNIKGKKIVFREILIEGPNAFHDLSQFLDDRQSYLEKSYDVKAEEYHTKSGVEIEQLLNIPLKSQIYLWFEHDLFCQMNMLFLLFLLPKHLQGCKFKVVYPLPLPLDQFWHGFGAMSTDDLSTCFTKAIDIAETDLDFAKQFWKAYSTNDVQSIEELSKYQSPALNHTGGAVQALYESYPCNDKLGRPKKRLMDLIELHGSEDFATIFKAFQKTEGIYGYGDLQVKKMIREIT